MIAIVISSFNKRVTDGLLEGCLLALKENNHSRDQIEIHEVPGAFELPAKVQYLNSKNKYSCLLYTSPSPRDRQKSRMPSSA